MLDVVADKIWEYEVVDSLRDECEAWKDRARYMLKASQVSIDLDDAQVTRMVEHDNGGPCDWDKYKHLCILGACHLGCTGASTS